MQRFTPDEDEYPTLEVPDFRRRAQFLLHLLIGSDISPEEYVEKMEMIETSLREVYQEASQLIRASHDYEIRSLREKATRTTRRPAPTDPGIGIPTIPPPPKVPELEIDWSGYEDDVPLLPKKV